MYTGSPMFSIWKPKNMVRLMVESMRKSRVNISPSGSRFGAEFRWLPDVNFSVLSVMVRFYIDVGRSAGLWWISARLCLVG